MANRGAADNVRLVLTTRGLVGSAETLAGKLAVLAANKRQLEWVLQAAVLDDPAPTMSVRNHVGRCQGAQPDEKAGTSGESTNVAFKAESEDAQVKHLWNWWAKSQKESENIVRSQADAETWWPAQRATLWSKPLQDDLHPPKRREIESLSLIHISEPTRPY